MHHTTPKFKIGDELRHVVKNSKAILFVVSVTSETCPGGTQHHYACRPIFRSATSIDFVKFNEVELRYSTPEELEAESRSQFAVWCDIKKESAVSEKDFEKASAWLSVRKAMEALAKEAT